MRVSLYVLILMLFSLGIATAQTCLSLGEQLELLMDACSEIEANKVCASDDDSETDLATVETLVTDNENSLLVRLNREDIPIYLLTVGTVSLDNTTPRGEITVSATRNVNLRSVPSVDGTIIGSMTIREEYTAIGRLADNTWIRIRLDDGRIGWASAQFFVSQEGYTQLDALTPTAPPYLPMQSVIVSTGDCGTLFLIATSPEPEESETESDSVPEAIIYGINGAQITVNGIVAITVVDDTLTVTSVIGEHMVNAFGFETLLTINEQTQIPLSSENMIASITSEPETVEPVMEDETVEQLFDGLSMEIASED